MESVPCERLSSGIGGSIIGGSTVYDIIIHIRITGKDQKLEQIRFSLHVNFMLIGSHMTVGYDLYFIIYIQ